MTATIVTTERLVVRGWSDEDAAQLVAITTVPELVQYLGRPSWTMEDATELIGLWRRVEATLGITTWACPERSSGSLIGYCGFIGTNAAWLRQGLVEIGWLLAREWWGQGLATEAARAVLPLGTARVGTVRIISKCNVQNTASEAVMRRLGLRRVGLVRRPQDITVLYRVPLVRPVTDSRPPAGVGGGRGAGPECRMRAAPVAKATFGG